MIRANVAELKESFQVSNLEFMIEKSFFSTKAVMTYMFNKSVSVVVDSVNQTRSSYLILPKKHFRLICKQVNFTNRSVTRAKAASSLGRETSSVSEDSVMRSRLRTDKLTNKDGFCLFGAALRGRLLRWVFSCFLGAVSLMSNNWSPCINQIGSCRWGNGLHWLCQGCNQGLMWAIKLSV